MRASCLMRGIALSGLAVCATTVTTETAAATESGFYVQADAGFADYPDNARLELGETVLTRADASTGDFTWGINAGYRFNRYLAVDAGWVDLGEVSVNLRDNSGAVRGELRFRAQGPRVNVLGSWPLGNWEPFIKAGVLFQDVSLEFNGNAGGAPLNVSTDSDGTKLVWGLGVSYRLGEHWSLRLAADYYDEIGEENITGTANVLSTTFGFFYRF